MAKAISCGGPPGLARLLPVLAEGKIGKIEPGYQEFYPL
jgi:hypothetical protein